VSITAQFVHFIQIEPYVMIDGPQGESNASVSYNTKPKFKGFIPDLLDDISRMTDFHFDLHLVEEGSYGFRQDDGEWNGVIGEVKDGVSDL
jgi:hypothetical protein